VKITYICLLITGLMPILCTAIAKWGFKDFDNHNPRLWLSAQNGFRARANAAQSNCFEALPFFAISVGCAMAAQVNTQLLQGSCILFVGLRLLYIVFYISDKATLRTLMWCSAYSCVIFNFVQAINVLA